MVPFSFSFKQTHTHIHTEEEIKKEFTRTARPVVFVGLKWVTHTHTLISPLTTHAHTHTQDK